MSALLEVRGLEVRYGRMVALRNVDLSVAPGEAVGLIGPNGAGKTTLLSAIFGLATVTAGEILFDGRPLPRRAPEKVVRRGLALVPEGRHILGGLTVAENLVLGATPNPGTLKEDLPAVLERFPVLERYYDEPAATLSGGEQQQLAIARALLSRPRLLLLDEPSLGLAPLVVDLVFEALEDLRRTGVTILLVEQVLRRTVKFADRTYVLRNGELVLSGTREEMEARGDLADAYLGPAAARS